MIRTFGGWDEARHIRHCAECLARGHVWVIEVEGRPVGMIQLHESAREVEIGEVQLLPNHQRHGLGSQLLGDTLADAHGRDRTVRLSVALKNDGALRLYRRLGFCDVSRSDTHYLMECRPPGPFAGS
jgi:ribosomal protein S18 acetylase RimI-like enzyme